MSHNEMLYDEYNASSKADERAYQRDELIYNTTEDILILLEDMNISKKELARRLGKSQSYVTQTLSGSRNMTLSSLSDICYALGKKVMLKINNHQVDDAPAVDSLNSTTSFHINENKARLELESQTKIYDSIKSLTISHCEHSFDQMQLLQKKSVSEPAFIIKNAEREINKFSNWHSLALSSYSALTHAGHHILSSSLENRGGNIIDRRDINHWQKEVA